MFDLLYLFAAVAYSPIVIYRAVRYKRYHGGWGQRFGKVTRRNPSKRCIWLHTVSVGEVNAAKTLVEELTKRFGDFEIIISTTTDTGFARASALFGERFEVFYFPLDFSWIMRRAFKRIKPTLCLLMEQEVWPNFVEIAQRLNIPVIVVNGRISEKGFARYKKIRPIAKKIFQKVGLILAQTDEYAQRFKEIGCPEEKVIVTGSLKYDTAQITDKVEGTDALAEQLNLGDEKLWVAGATGPGEEKIILDVFKELIRQFSNLRLVIVPRKPERFGEVAQLIKEKGFDLLRYSSVKTGDRRQETENRKQRMEDRGWKNNFDNRQSDFAKASSFADASEDGMPDRSSIVVLGDTMGDLRKFYSLATIIFVGRSLVPMGGSDMIEAAALGKCTIFGPHTFNFKQAVDALLADDGAIMVKDGLELLEVMRKCLTDTKFARRIAQNSQEVIRKNQGATAKTIEQITNSLIVVRKK